MPGGEISITKASIGDVAMLRELSITTFTDTFAKDNAKEDMDLYVAEEMNEEKLRQELQDAYSLFFLAWYDNTLAGYAKIRTSKVPPALTQHKPMELERIYVLKGYHSKKVGAALMNLCLTHAVNHGHDVLWLGVWGANHKAINFYKKWGFELFGEHQFRLGNDVQTDVLMKKML